MKLTDFDDRHPGMFALFVGPSGSGKTIGALSFPNVYSFDMDRKLPGVALKHFRGRTDIEWDAYDDIFQIADKISAFQKDCPFETLVFDSVTQLSTMCLNAVGKAKGENVPDMLKSTARSKGKSIELMGIDYYNGETNYIMRYWLDALRVLYIQPGNPKHVIVIAHDIITESAPDLKTKLTTRSSSIVTAGRKVAAGIPTVFDDRYYFTIRADEEDHTAQAPVRRICLTQAVGEEYAKCSYQLPRSIDFTNLSLYAEFQKYLSL